MTIRNTVEKSLKLPSEGIQRDNFQQGGDSCHLPDDETAKITSSKELERLPQTFLLPKRQTESKERKVFISNSTLRRKKVAYHSSHSHLVYKTKVTTHSDNCQKSSFIFHENYVQFVSTKFAIHILFFFAQVCPSKFLLLWMSSSIIFFKNCPVQLQAKQCQKLNTLTSHVPPQSPHLHVFCLDYSSTRCNLWC